MMAPKRASNMHPVAEPDNVTQSALSAGSPPGALSTRWQSCRRRPAWCKDVHGVWWKHDPAENLGTQLAREAGKPGSALLLAWHCSRAASSTAAQLRAAALRSHHDAGAHNARFCGVWGGG